MYLPSKSVVTVASLFNVAVNSPEFVLKAKSERNVFSSGPPSIVTANCDVGFTMSNVSSLVVVLNDTSSKCVFCVAYLPSKSTVTSTESFRDNVKVPSVNVALVTNVLSPSIPDKSTSIWLVGLTIFNNNFLVLELNVAESR